LQEGDRKGYLYTGKDDLHALEKCLDWKIPQTSPKEGVCSHPAMLPARQAELKKKKKMLLLVVF